MKISIRRSGGFAGISEEITSLDTGKLNQAAAQGVENLVRELDLFNLPTNPPGQKVGADFLKYEITVSDRGKQHTIIFNDDDAPPTARLRDFVQRLTQFR